MLCVLYYVCGKLNLRSDLFFLGGGVVGGGGRGCYRSQMFSVNYIN